jgi:hypothetical protein
LHHRIGFEKLANNSRLSVASSDLGSVGKLVANLGLPAGSVQFDLEDHDLLPVIVSYK